MTVRQERKDALFTSRRSVLGNYVWGGFALACGLIGFVASLLALLWPGRSPPLFAGLVAFAGSIAVVDYGIHLLTEYIEVRRESIFVRSRFGLRTEIVRWDDLRRITLFDSAVVGVTTSLLLHHPDGKLHVPHSPVRQLHSTCQAILGAALASNPSIEVERAVMDMYGSPPYEMIPRPPSSPTNSGGAG